MRDVNNFGAFIQHTRLDKRLTMENVCKGLCDIATMSRIENGILEPQKLLKDAILGRIGISSEYFDIFLQHEEYVRWNLRQKIIHALMSNDLEDGKSLLNNYIKTADMSLPLEKRFYLIMKYQLLKAEYETSPCIEALITNAIKTTLPDFSLSEYRNETLSIEEKCLITEYINLSENTTIFDFFELYDYIKRTSSSSIVYVKVMPQLIVYAYNRFRNIDSESISGLRPILFLCDEALENLQKANRAFYLYEILSVEKDILARLINFEVDEIKKNEYKSRYSEITSYIAEYSGLYDENNLKVQMCGICHIYDDNEAYDISEVVKSRRKMLGLTMAELAEGVCSERSISRLEQNKTDSQKEMVKLLFEKMSIGSEFNRMGIISDDPEVFRKLQKLKICCNNRDKTEANELIAQIEKDIDISIIENAQAIRRYKILANSFGDEQYNKHKFLDEMVQCLEMTIPIENVLSKGKHYLSRNEIMCLQSIITTEDYKNEIVSRGREVLEEYFLANDNMFTSKLTSSLILGTISSLKGNNGEYECSESMDRYQLRELMIERKIRTLHRFKYGILWNVIKKNNEKGIAFDNAVFEKELTSCIVLASLSSYNKDAEFYKKVLKYGIIV